MFDGTIGEVQSQTGNVVFEAPADAADTGTFQVEIPTAEGTDRLHWVY